MANLRQGAIDSSELTKETPIYTIGYGLRSVEDFLSFLQAYGIEYVADVRSNPYSKWNPDFCREPIAAFLQEQGVGYVYLGDMIGGIPKDDHCYTDGRLDPQKAQNHEAFKGGISRLLKAQSKGIVVALMCGEIEPHKCHRSKLIGEVLTKKGIQLLHIINETQLKTQTQVMLELTKGKSTTDLFGNPTL